jgi:hypothetical protein
MATKGSGIERLVVTRWLAAACVPVWGSLKFKITLATPNGYKEVPKTFFFFFLNNLGHRPGDSNPNPSAIL